MQYKAGNKEKKKQKTNWANIESLMLILKNSVTIPIARIAEANNSQKNIKPAFCTLLPWDVVNSNLSLSKDRLVLDFTSKITDIKESQNTIPPNGCGIILPSNNPAKNVAKKITFQKLSSLSLLFIKSLIRVSRFLFNNYFNYTMYCAQLIGFCRHIVHFTKDIALLWLKEVIFTQIVQIVRFQSNSMIVSICKTGSLERQRMLALGNNISSLRYNVKQKINKETE